ncbi:30S ribosomal protein S4 [Candidatus Woesearchaeota archaeon B3_Woes]|nr:MAG: 30S ribosomal protein S4 [Candidatus Woesearchaeota archaeon B3_Woes]
MGDPRKARKKYKTPSHPWQKARLEEETKLAEEYGLKNKEEIWKMDSFIKNFTNQSKKLVTLVSKQAEKEKLNLIKKLKTLGLLKQNQGFENILNLTIRDVMERRLQTLVHRKGLAKTMKQARQLIIHSHINIGDQRITSPSYLINIDEEKKISFASKSAFSSPDHPERVIKELKAKKKTEEKEEKKPKAEKKEIKKETKPKKEKTEVKEEKKESKKKKNILKKKNQKKTNQKIKNEIK